MEESILKLQLLEKKDLAEPEIDIRYSSMTQPLNRIVQYIRQQEYLIQGIFEKKLYQIINMKRGNIIIREPDAKTQSR